MDYTKKSRAELLALCKEKGVKGYSTKKKNELIDMLQKEQITPSLPKETKAKEELKRLDYIGSKYQLLDWLTQSMKEKTSLESFEGKTVADLFAGTGVVSFHFRKLGAKVLSNDAELYSHIIAKAFNQSSYTDPCKELLDTLNKELKTNKLVGYITKNYSPYEGNERKFFTEENAMKIDYARMRIDTLKETLKEDVYTFLLASLLVSADSISNVPAVYGCFLKEFKKKAQKEFTLIAVHNYTNPCVEGSETFHSDVLGIPKEISADIVYLDPPYNERQYSKNYFPLNMIAKTPLTLEQEPPLKGKTGIPTDCFLSPFCKKGKPVEDAFVKLFKTLNAKWIFVSYNSESLISKEKMLELMQPYGVASVIERHYKRFKSFEYNEDKEIKEYLFCLQVNNR